MVKLLVIGPNGKMGRAMTHQAHSHPEMELVGGVGPKGCCYSGTDEIIHSCDVAVECTNAEASLTILDKCVAAAKPLVSGTTGFTTEQKILFQMAGESIPVLLASNTSKIAHLYFRLIDEVARYQRKGKGARPPGTIDYTSIRTGNFPTSHKVIFGFENEKLELTLDGYNMLPYAEGMIEAAWFLYDKKPGIYTIEQAIAPNI